MIRYLSLCLLLGACATPPAPSEPTARDRLQAACDTGDMGACGDVELLKQQERAEERAYAMWLLS